MPTRILIHGVTGSGKTTLGACVAARTGLPWHSVDDLTWEPVWISVPEDEQRRRIESICASDRWILDSAYAHWLDVPLARADLIVALDYPRWLSLARLIRRCVTRAVDRQPICNANTETLRQLFSRDSMIVWHFRSFRRKRVRMREWAGDESLPEVLRMTSPRVAARWLATLSDSGLVSTSASNAAGSTA